MKITYIHHSSFMAELDHAVLLFDYFEGNIPETDRDEAFVCVCQPPPWRPFFPFHI